MLIFVFVLVQLVIPGEDGSGKQSTSKQPLVLTSNAAATAVRFSFADSGDEGDADATLPGTSRQAIGQRKSIVSEAESHTLDPFVARK